MGGARAYGSYSALCNHKNPNEKALQEELYGSVVLMSPSINFLFHSII